MHLMFARRFRVAMFTLVCASVRDSGATVWGNRRPNVNDVCTLAPDGKTVCEVLANIDSFPLAATDLIYRHNESFSLPPRYVLYAWRE